MKILFTVQFLYGGMGEVVLQLSRRLAQKGHHITIFTGTHPDNHQFSHKNLLYKAFNIQGNFVKGYVGNTDEYVKTVVSGDFDIIVLFAAQQWACDLLLPHLDKIRAKKVFVPTGFSNLYHPSYSKYYELMKQWLTNIDVAILLSETYQDSKYIKKYVSSKKNNSDSKWCR